MNEETELQRLTNLPKFTSLVKQLAESLVEARPAVWDCVLAVPTADTLKPLISSGYMVVTLSKGNVNAI